MQSISLEKGTRLHRLAEGKSILLTAVITYLVAAIGWSFVDLKYVAPFIHHIVAMHISTLWSRQLASLVSTWVGGAFFPITLYLFVVRPHRLKPVLNSKQRPNLVTLIVITVFITALFFAFTPMDQLSSRTLLLAVTFVGVGFSEEFSFRGVLTRIFRDRFGIVWATVIVSCMFSLSHWAEWIYVEHTPLNIFGESFFTIFFMGIVLTVMAWRSGTLWWAIAIHTLNDVGAQLGSISGVSWRLLLFMLCCLAGAELLRIVSKSHDSVRFCK